MITIQNTFDAEGSYPLARLGDPPKQEREVFQMIPQQYAFSTFFWKKVLVWKTCGLL